jgi:hypothetical protein
VFARPAIAQVDLGLRRTLADLPEALGIRAARMFTVIPLSGQAGRPFGRIEGFNRQFPCFDCPAGTGCEVPAR